MTEQQRGLEPADVALMRAIVIWRREQGSFGDSRVEFSTNRGWGGFLSWKETYPVPIRERREVAVEVAHRGSVDPEDYPRQLRLSWSEPKRGEMHLTCTMEPRDLTEGVDILVALKFLPARFSSAYRAGWDTAMQELEHPCGAGRAFAAIIPRGGQR